MIEIHQSSFSQNSYFSSNRLLISLLLKKNDLQKANSTHYKLIVHKSHRKEKIYSFYSQLQALSFSDFYLSNTDNC
jgi:hypothetical protein